MPDSNEKIYTRDEFNCALAKVKEEYYQKNAQLMKKYNALCKLLKNLAILFDGDA